MQRGINTSRPLYHRHLDAWLKELDELSSQEATGMNQTLEAGVVLPVDLEATHPYVLEFVSLEELQAHALSSH